MIENNQVDTELLTQIKEVLSAFPEYWDGETLLRNRVTEDIRSYKDEVIEALLNNELIKNTYWVFLPNPSKRSNSECSNIYISFLNARQNAF